MLGVRHPPGVGRRPVLRWGEGCRRRPGGLWSSHARAQCGCAAALRVTSARAGLTYEVMGTGGHPALLVIPGWVSAALITTCRGRRSALLLAAAPSATTSAAADCGARTAEASALGVEAQVEDVVAVLDAGAAGSAAGLVRGCSRHCPRPHVTRSGFPPCPLRHVRAARGRPLPCGQPPEVVQSLRLLVWAEWPGVTVAGELLRPSTPASVPGSPATCGRRAPPRWRPSCTVMCTSCCLARSW